MNYRLDKKTKEKRFFYIILCVLVFAGLFYFRSEIGAGLSSSVHGLFRPIWDLGSSAGEKGSGLKSYFLLKRSLRSENQLLKEELKQKEALVLNYDSLLEENINLKKILGRSMVENLSPRILSAVLGKPNSSPYDTLVIDVGEKQGVRKENIVFALSHSPLGNRPTSDVTSEMFGNLPIGRVVEVYSNSSKVVLFSTAGERTRVVVSGESGGIFLEAVGRGGGNFEMILPRNFVPRGGEAVLLPGIFPYVLAVVEVVISDPRDPFAKALLKSPVNVFELKFVQVEMGR